jgi:hypothetical protein
MNLGNKKCISSEELFGAKEEKSQEIKDRYSALQGARAISSDMFFGEEDKMNRESEGNGGNGSSSNRGKL